MSDIERAAAGLPVGTELTEDAGKDKGVSRPPKLTGEPASKTPAPERGKPAAAR